MIHPHLVWVGIIQSIEGPNGTKKSDRGKAKLFSLLEMGHSSAPALYLRTLSSPTFGP
jgi:hypothetical protein